MPSRLIEIPPDDIFKNDRLDLEPAIRVRSEALLSNSPQAIAIDGAWGSGKSTFMALWEAYLRREGVKVVTFNAWKFSLSDPLDALTREILRQFEEIPVKQRQSGHRRLLEFVRQSVPHIRRGLKLGSQFSPELAEAIEVVDPYADSAEAVVDSAMAVPSDSERLADQKASISSPEAFTFALCSAAKDWSEKPVVIMVDELDRCSPEYAVEMLQLMEHVFCADNVVFVVSIKLAELVHSVKAFYGQGFNADGYLERFFDYVLPLPASNRLRYIEVAFESINAVARGFYLSSALRFLNASELSLREIDKAVSQLDEALDSYTPTNREVGFVDLWLARTLAPVEYKQFVSGEISDKILADAIFDSGTCGELRADSSLTNYQSDAEELEGVLIIASCLRDIGPSIVARDEPFANSALYAHYQSEIESTQGIEGNRSTYPSRVIGRANSLFEALRFRQVGLDTLRVTRLLDRDAIPS